MNRKLYYYNKAIDIAESKGWEIISKVEDYETAHSPLSVICGNEHIFKISLNNISRKWCPMCNIRINEYTTLLALEYLFQTQFKKIRPEWLRNQEGNRLEIDCFNEELKLCVEYNGKQHYEYVHHFHRTEENFLKLSRDDELKKKICVSKGYLFIEVPYTIHMNDIIYYLANKCNEMSLSIVNENLELFEAKMSAIANRNNEILLLIIKEKEGTLLSGKYMTRDSIVDVRCKKGHIFSIKCGKIIYGTWCKYCCRPRTEEVRRKTSNNMKKWFATDEGRSSSFKSHQKRSETMAKTREKYRQEITDKVCTTCKSQKT